MEERREMTAEAFVEELKGHWSWLYEMYVSKLCERQWAQWELLTIAGVLSLLLLLKIRRRRRKAAARIVYPQRVSGDPSIISVKLARSQQVSRNGEDLQGADESDVPQVQRKRHHWTTAAEESDWAEQPVRDLRREIIKRDQTEARLGREITELSVANEKLEREVAGLMAVNERLLHKVTEGERVGEPSGR
ncbi:MAG: hypothetical protein H8E73_02435 [Planctomycetes bacterium]|nr:hypothetical protein [Planctomycetota bacterium]